MSNNTYLAQYWRNDGGWHDSGYDMSPTLVFQADSDDHAKELALAYIGANKRGREEFWLSKLARMNFSTQDVPFDDKGSEAVKPDKDLESRLSAAKFTPLRDAIVPSSE
jgi:hypothetical protein